MNSVTWRSFKIAEADVGWEAASYNVKWEDGKEYGRWREGTGVIDIAKCQPVIFRTVMIQPHENLRPRIGCRQGQCG